jgi:hypothetical protein
VQTSFDLGREHCCDGGRGPVQGGGQQKDSNVQLASGDIGGQNVKMTWLRLNE